MGTGSELLSQWLQDVGMSQAEFGRLIGVQRSTVTNWLNGDRRPTLDTAALIERETDGEVPAVSWARLDD